MGDQPDAGRFSRNSSSVINGNPGVISTECAARFWAVTKRFPRNPGSTVEGPSVNKPKRKVLARCGVIFPVNHAGMDMTSRVDMTAHEFGGNNNGCSPLK
jgi:hypothetical protein